MLLCIAAAALVGCKEEPGKQFAEYTSGLGLGISFDQSRSEVQALLGTPQASTERETYVEDHYIPVIQGAQQDMPDLKAVQLTTGYVNGVLVSLYNRYTPEVAGSPYPPHIVEPASGARLGNRRSDFEAALGPGNYGPMNDAWRFESVDGRAVVIQGHFEPVAALGGDMLCTTVSIVVETEATGRGEYYEKQQERMDRGNEALR